MQKNVTNKEEKVKNYMTDEFIAVRDCLSIKEATAETIRKAGNCSEIFTIYAVDEANKYVGTVQLKDLIISRQNDDFRRLIAPSPFLFENEEIAERIDALKACEGNSMPVLNERREIVGVVTPRELLEVAEDEFEEDYAKFGGLTEEEELNEPVRTSIRKRWPWLIALLLLGLIVSSVISVFEAVIATFPVIVFFQSMILDMSGNVGTQSLAVTIRNLGDKETAEEKRRRRKSVLKEFKIGLLNGVIIGAFALVVVLAYLSITRQEVVEGNGYVFLDALSVGAIVAVSMFLSIALSSVIGTVFPILLTKLHVDPAVASGPFITTLNDIVAVVVYYGLTFVAFSAL